MSWDTSEFDLFSVCACGKGKVVRHVLQLDDDWDRTETSNLGEDILCPECKSKYHIEHHVRYYSMVPSWVGSGTSDRAFLVPNDIQIPDYQAERYFDFSSIHEKIAANYPLLDIQESIKDMLDNQFATRVQLSSSFSIIRMYYKKFKKKNLKLIVPVLQEVARNYYNYEWNYEAITAYRETERIEIEKNNKAIETAMEQSFELHFTREVRHDQT